MSLVDRVKKLERRPETWETIHELDYSTDDIIRKLGFDPDVVRATARISGRSMASVITGELGMSCQDFLKSLKLKANVK